MLNEQKLCNALMNVYRKTKQTDIVKNNKEIFEKWSYYAPSGAVVTLPPKAELLQNAKCYSEPFSVAERPANSSPTLLYIEEDDVVDTTKRLIQRGLSPVVLSFANGYFPCGLYEEGGDGREEYLCRISTLSCTLNSLALRSPSPYPMNLNYGGIYSRVAVFREGSDKGYCLLEEPWMMSVVSVPALNLRGSYHHERIVRNTEYAVHGEKSMTDEGKAIMLNKIRTIYRIAIEHGHDSIVLGAWGCGLYKQRPQLIAQMFKDVLDELEFRRKFKEVHSVIEDHKQYVQYVRSVEGNERFKCTDRPAYFCFKVGDDRIWGAEYPGDSIESVARNKIQNALDFGITHFIDLTEEGELPPYNHLLPNDGSINYLRFPIKDARAPKSIESVSRLITEMEDILKRKDAKIYLHCWGGVGRTGTISACWIAHKFNSNYCLVMSRLQTYWRTCLKSYSQPIPDHWSQKEFIKTYVAFERYQRLIAPAKKLMIRELCDERKASPGMTGEELVDNTYMHLYEKYVEGGYSALWKNRNSNAVNLQFLQQLIRDDVKTKELLREML